MGTKVLTINPTTDVLAWVDSGSAPSGDYYLHIDSSTDVVSWKIESGSLTGYLFSCDDVTDVISWVAHA